MTEHAPWQTGTVTRMGARAFGFIKPDEGADVFFHYRECRLRYAVLNMNVGDKVEFQLNQFANDRRAAKVRVLR